MKKYLKVFIIFSTAMLLTSCNSSSSSTTNGNGGGGGGTQAAGAEGDYYATYELSASCSTGLKSFTGKSAEEIGTQFCNALKDDSLNNYCASYLRSQVFKSVECPGEWTSPIGNGYNSSYQKSYAYTKTNCGTGLHVFSASDSKVAQRMYCEALMNDSFNRNCAREERQEAYNKAECNKN